MQRLKLVTIQEVEGDQTTTMTVYTPAQGEDYDTGRGHLDRFKEKYKLNQVNGVSNPFYIT